jgi:hypothetical protein
MQKLKRNWRGGVPKMKFLRENTKVWSTLIIVIFLILGGYYIVGAGPEAEPGSDLDPAVAKSYVDQQDGLLIKKIDELTVRLNASDAKIALSETKAAAIDAKMVEKDKQILDLQGKLAIANTKLLDGAKKQTELDKKIVELTTKLGEMESIENSTTGNDTTVKDTTGKETAPTSKTAVYQVVKVKAGKRLVAGVSTEIVLRSGKATAIGTANGGILDLSASVLIATGKIVPLNHLLLSQLNDGKGFKAVTDVMILIRGPYQIK